MKQIELLDIDKPREGKYQFYLDWFKEAWIRAGGKVKSKKDFPTSLRLVIAKLKIGRRLFFVNKTKSLLVIGGAYIDFTSFPYNYSHEIIPVFWDTWKKYHPLLLSSLKRNKIKYAFFTQKEVAEMVSQAIPEIKTFWMPEGINSDGYKKGTNLNTRKINILQYGRKLDIYHNVILESLSQDHKYFYSNNDLHKLFKDFEELTEGLSNSSISICFPRSMTHPALTGGIETLTQRYWESLLSRCLIIGKAPKELICIMGYNPVIEVDWQDPKKQLLEILENIENYQDFVNDNYLKAIERCSWDFRIASVRKTIKDLGYKLN